MLSFFDFTSTSIIFFRNHRLSLVALVMNIFLAKSSIPVFMSSVFTLQFSRCHSV